MNIDFTGQRPPFQGIFRPETNQYAPQNRKFCGWAVVNFHLQQPQFFIILLHTVHTAQQADPGAQLHSIRANAPSPKSAALPPHAANNFQGQIH
ncbi:MAG: hypothetical protein J6I45_11605 [Clostridia bacterium]|nr:hypothetical protein [Clostridia bacterium]